MSALRYVSSLLPSLRDYRATGRTWRGDLIAGITVGIVALPLALAFGVSSGAGAEAGLITAVVAGVVAGIFGGSNVQVSGPTGAMVVVLGPIVASRGPGVVAILAILGGGIVLLLGALKLGRLVGFIPWPVIEGFTVGIAAVIFLQQVPEALGVRAGSSSNAAVAAVQAFAAARWQTIVWPIAIVLVVVGIMLVGPRIHALFPGSLVAIIVVSVAAWIAHLPVARLGALPAHLPAPHLPAIAIGSLGGLIGPAVTIAALASIESLLSARVAASISDSGPYNGDRELVGQGLASIASGLFGGMPATGAIARTAVNVRSGGRTRVAAVVHSLVLLGVVYLATGPVSHIPLAALGGVLMLTAVRMVSVSTVRTIVGSTRSDTIVFILTAIITVSFNLITAVEIGVAVAAFFALRSLSRSAGVRRDELPGPVTAGDEHIALFRLDGALFFGAAQRVLDEVSQIRDVQVVIIRLSQIQVMDASGARVIAEIVRTLEGRGITVLVKGVQAQHLRLVTRVGVLGALRHENHLFDDLAEATAHARSHIARGPTAVAPNAYVGRSRRQAPS